MDVALREPRPEKVAVVDEVRTRFEAAQAAILTEYRGIAVADLEALRRSLRAAGGEYKIYKNTLVRRATGDGSLAELAPLLVGPTAIAFVSGDVAAVAKVLRDFSRTNPNLVVKGGLIGESLLDARTATALADLPSREVLLGQLAGMLAAPMQRFAGLLQAIPQQFAYGLAALQDMRAEAGGESPPEAASAPSTEEAAADHEAVGDEATDGAAAAEAPAAEAPATDAPAAETSAAEASEVTD